MNNRGSLLVGALVFVSALGFLWVADFSLRLTERIQEERLMAMESAWIQSVDHEWTAYREALAQITPEASPAFIEYQLEDGWALRQVRLKVVWEQEQWNVVERQVLWAPKPVSL